MQMVCARAGAFALMACLALVVVLMRKFGKGPDGPKPRAKFAAFCLLYVVTYGGLMLKRTTDLLPDADPF